jgi:hypothetical protein
MHIMTKPFRHILAGLTVALLLQLNLGCSIMDEINAANDAVGNNSANNEKAAAKEREAEAAASAENQKKLAVKEWWDEATSMDPEDLDKSIVKCDVGGSVSFMSDGECISRGGTVQ